MKWYKTIASVLGIGYADKGGGTLAALFYCIVWLLLPAGFSSNAWQVIITILIIITGIWVSNLADKDWGKDSSKVVIDEVAGMAISLLYLPHTWPVAVAGLIAFRFFDIAKPLGIRQLEKWPKGWGVMADDILAGIYALIVVQLLVQFKLL